MQNQADKAMEEWMKTATLADIEAMEAQGVDMTVRRAKFEENKKKEAEMDEIRYGAWKVDNSKVENPIDLSKLDQFDTTPRDLNSEFVQGYMWKLPWFWKDKVKKQAENWKIIYASIVQANSGLWEAWNFKYLPAVIVFAVDDGHRRDVAWVKAMAKKISDLKYTPQVPVVLEDLIKTLRDDQSMFCKKIDNSISDWADAWCATYSFPTQEILPKKHLPTEWIVPFILKDVPEQDNWVWFFNIPAKYYAA